MSLWTKAVKLLFQLAGNYQNHFFLKIGFRPWLSSKLLSLLLFEIVIDFLMEDMEDGSLMKLLFVDSLAFHGELLDSYGEV